MRRCKECDIILVPVPEIENLTGYPLEICLKCLIDGVKQIEAIERNQIEP